MLHRSIGVLGVLQHMQWDANIGTMPDRTLQIYYEQYTPDGTVTYTINTNDVNGERLGLECVNAGVLVPLSLAR